jgi:hypothetical protein
MTFLKQRVSDHTDDRASHGNRASRTPACDQAPRGRCRCMCGILLPFHWNPRHWPNACSWPLYLMSLCVAIGYETSRHGRTIQCGSTAALGYVQLQNLGLGSPSSMQVLLCWWQRRLGGILDTSATLKPHRQHLVRSDHVSMQLPRRVASVSWTLWHPRRATRTRRSAKVAAPRR